MSDHIHFCTNSILLFCWVHTYDVYFQIFFFVPFYDQNVNKQRLDRIREAIKLDVQLDDSQQNQA